VEAGGTVLFDKAPERAMQHEEPNGLEKRGVPTRKPDQVFGLARTYSLDLYTKRELFEGMRHGPFADSELLYPFLICEAKAEDGEGFEAIEAQTAFPIRTCLKLQDNLRQTSGVPLKPFVWFLAYHGDEWRVAACILSEGKYVSSYSKSGSCRQLFNSVCFQSK
jgi:hypothetical protein